MKTSFHLNRNSYPLGKGPSTITQPSDSTHPVHQFFRLTTMKQKIQILPNKKNVEFTYFEVNRTTDVLVLSSSRGVTGHIPQVVSFESTRSE